MAGHQPPPERDQTTVVEPLTRKVAEQNIEKLVELANLIPLVDYTAGELLAEQKSDGRQLCGKWAHSYVLKAYDEVCGFLIGYERQAEGTSTYPLPSLYMSELAVAPETQGKGFATQLVTRYLADAFSNGKLTHLDDAPLYFSLQTNAADWNEPARLLYEKFGFKTIGRKPYENRSDVVMWASAEDVKDAIGEDH